MVPILNSAHKKLQLISFWLNSDDDSSLDTVPRLDSQPFVQKKFWLTLPFQPVAQKGFTHSFSDSTWWWEPSWILPCWIQTPCYFSQKMLTQTTLHSTLTLTQTNSFLIQLDDASHLEICHLEYCHLGFSHLSVSSHTALTLVKIDFLHLHKKNFTHSFWLNFDDGSHLEFCHVGFRHCHVGFRRLVIFSQIHSKTLSLYSDSDSN